MGRPTMTAVPSLTEPLTRVRAALEEVFAPLEGIAAAFIAERRAAIDAGKELTAERVARLRDLIWGGLGTLPSADGLGFVAAPGAVEGRERHLEWWQRAASGGYTRIRLNLDPDSVDLYDYLDMDWFTGPRRDGRRHVYGPYIDFAGAEGYVLTMTVPARDGEFLGVAGADIRMSALEPDLFAILRSAPAATVLVTGERRVVAANTPRWIAGSRLDRLPAAGDGTFEAAADVGADSGWVLAVGCPGT